MLYLEPTPEMERSLQDVINRLWAGEHCLRRLGRGARPSCESSHERCSHQGFERVERLRRAERRSKAIYIHSHMDEETFDTDRIRQCCVGIREPDGTNIPSCAYNMLYRDRTRVSRNVPRPPW